MHRIFLYRTRFVPDNHVNRFLPYARPLRNDSLVDPEKAPKKPRGSLCRSTPLLHLFPPKPRNTR